MSLELASSSPDVRITALFSMTKNGTHAILAALGGVLEVYVKKRERGDGDSDEGFKRSDSAKILKGDVIHGIFNSETERDLENSNLFVYGGKQVAFVAVDIVGGRIGQVLWRDKLEDWIVSCIELVDEKLVALTSHNRLVFFPSNGSPEKPQGTNVSVDCQEKCILYSGQLIGEKCGKAVVALSGTVFSEIVVWKADMDVETARDTGRSKGADEKSCLHRLRGHEGVIFSVQYSQPLSLICSTSDDRTARLWRVCLDEGGRDDWSSVDITISHVLRGHSARVFRSCFVGESVVTGGEDGKICVWSTDSGFLLEERAAHAPVWSLCANSADNAHFYSGGEQGILRHWRRANELDSLTPTKYSPFWESGDPPRVVRSHPSGAMVCLTTGGTIFKISGDQVESWQCFPRSSLANYALVEVLGDDVIFATLDGHLLVAKWEHGKFARFRMHQGKIFSLHLLAAGLSLTCGANGELKLACYWSGTVKKQITLSKTGPQQWPSCARISEDRSLLLLGDRNAYLHAYRLGKNNGEMEENRQEMESAMAVAITKVHRGQGEIGDIMFVVEDDGNGRAVMATVGRDGYKILLTLKVESECGQESCRMVVESRTKLPLPWADKFCKFCDDTLLLGFKASKFVVYSSREGRVVAEVACGGGHREWDLRLHEREATLYFVKDRHLFSLAFNLAKLVKSEVRQGLHLLKINAICHFRLRETQYLVTAGEDGIVKLHHMTGAKRETVETLNSHISSVKCLKAVTMPLEECVYLVSAGGRAQLRLWRIIQVDGRTVISEMATHSSMGSDKRRKKVWRDRGVILDAEVRHVSVEACLSNNGRFLFIYLGSSDGVLRTLSADLLNSTITLDLECETHSIDHCFLRLHLRGRELLTSSTDGVLRCWSCQEEDKGTPLLWKVTSNTSGVNSLATLPQTVLAGDDGGSIAVLSGTEHGNPFCLLKRSLVHSAQITGLSVLGHEAVVSCSVDQRVTLWKLNHEDGSLNFVSQILTSVADVQDMCVWQDPDVDRRRWFLSLVGEGMELIQVFLQ